MPTRTANASRANTSSINPRVIGLGALRFIVVPRTSAKLSTNGGSPGGEAPRAPDLLSWFGVVGGWTKHKRPSSYFRADEDGTLIWIKQRTAAASKDCLCRPHPFASAFLLRVVLECAAFRPLSYCFEQLTVAQ